MLISNCYSRNTTLVSDNLVQDNPTVHRSSCQHFGDMHKKMGDFKLCAHVGLRDKSFGTVCDDAHLFTTIKYLYFLRSYKAWLTLMVSNMISHGLVYYSSFLPLLILSMYLLVSPANDWKYLFDLHYCIRSGSGPLCVF